MTPMCGLSSLEGQMCFMRAHHTEQTMCRQTLGVQTMCRQCADKLEFVCTLSAYMFQYVKVCLQFVCTLSAVCLHIVCSLSAHCLQFVCASVLCIQTTLSHFTFRLIARRNFQELLDHSGILLDNVKVNDDSKCDKCGGRCRRLFAPPPSSKCDTLRVLVAGSPCVVRC